MPNSCKTYSAYWNDTNEPLFTGVVALDLFQKIPAGSKIISGNSNRRGKTIVKATYQRGCRTFNVVEDDQKS